MITQSIVKNTVELVRAIAKGSDDHQEKGPVVVMIMFPNGRIVSGAYTKETPNITSRADAIVNHLALTPLVEALAVQGTSFVTQTGSDDMVCTLKWSTTDPINPPAK